jgi:nucleoside-diphosphate-sugar epimerase
MKVGVTGAAGFVGKAVVTALAAAGHMVVPFTRRPSGLTDEVVIGDIADPSARLPEGCELDVLIHLVALTHVFDENVSNELERYRAINVGGTQNALKLAHINGARRFIFLSSIKVNGESTQPGQPFTEENLPVPENPYGISKLEAEQLVVQEAPALGLDSVIIRPPLVYGIHARGNFPRLVRLANMGIPLPFGRISNARSMIFVENLANALTLCVGHPAAAGQTYLVSDGIDISTPQFVRLITSATGRKVRMLPISPKLLLVIARLCGQMGSVTRLCGSLQIDSSKIQRDLSWMPPVSVEDGVTQSVAEMTQHQHV